MNAETIAKYIKYKRGLNKTVLEFKGNIIKDIINNDVICSGGWKVLTVI